MIASSSLMELKGLAATVNTDFDDSLLLSVELVMVIDQKLNINIKLGSRLQSEFKQETT